MPLDLQLVFPKSVNCLSEARVALRRCLTRPNPTKHKLRINGLETWHAINGQAWKSMAINLPWNCDESELQILLFNNNELRLTALRLQLIAVHKIM